MEDLSEEPPTDINPYKVLEIRPTANSNEVKSAYRKLALRHHPGTHVHSSSALYRNLSKLIPTTDKAPPSAKDTAHTRFQEIAFAYAILSDERRRKRYDITGNTSESLDIGDDDFNWSDFFRAQWAEAVTGERLDNFKSTYQNSEEERRDVLKAYTASKGKMNGVFRMVMLSNPLDDEERFRGYIDQAIKEGGAEGYDAYVNESKKTRDERCRRARKEAKEAEEHAKESGIHESIFGPGDGKPKKSGKGNSESALADLIQQRHKTQSSNFLDDLAAKYAGGKKATNRGKKRNREDEPSEEAFQKTAERLKRRKAVEVEDEDEEDMMDVSKDDEAEPATNRKMAGSKNKKGKKNEKEEKPAKKRAAQARTRKAPTVDDDVDEDEDLNVESAASEPEVVPKKKAAKAKPSARKKR